MKHINTLDIHSNKPLAGDWCVMLLAGMLVVFLFKTLWHNERANKLQIRQGSQLYATLSLNQTRMLDIQGPIGKSRIIIKQGQVRFEHSPCPNQYCVHQGWLNKAGQVAICLPNQVSITLLGAEKSYDSLNY